MFLSRFLASCLWNGGFVCLLLALKRLLGSRVSLRFHYRCWYCLLASLLFPFLPWGLWPIPAVSRNAIAAYSLPGSGAAISGSLWLQDAVPLMVPETAGTAYTLPLLILWLAGVFALLGYYWCGSYRLRQIAQFAGAPSQSALRVFDACCRTLGLPPGIRLRQSRFLCAPISFGLRHPYVVLPKERTETLTGTELEHILLHELTHIRHRDLAVNYLVCALQALYWFHPGIWLAFRQMRRDREAYCDWAVLTVLGEEPERIAYGRTLLNFSAGYRTPFHTANGLCQNHRQLRYRLEQIVAFRQETGARRLLGRILALMLAAACFAQVPLMAFCAETAEGCYRPPEALSLREGGWEELFAEHPGCAVFYEASSERYTVYNQEEITRRVPPCSTFKIYSALNALNLGIITPEASALTWNGSSSAFPSWDRDQTLPSAMGQSVNWYFQELDRAAGVRQLEGFYRSIAYGNARVGSDPLHYWNGSALKISALEQVQLLAKLWRNDFGFPEAHIRAVLDSLLLSSGPGCRLYGKTGTGMAGNTNVAGWFVGYAQGSGGPCFFAVYLADSGADGRAAAEITLEILNRMGMEPECPL